MPDERAPTQLRQITKLCWPFPEKVIQTNPSGGGSYVAHPLVEQRIIDVLGRPPNTELVHMLRGMVAGKAPDPDASSARGRAGSPQLDDAVVGVILRMSCTIDGEPWFAEEIGDCEDPHNWKTDGQRAKDAFSDAYKRCAMRLGVALHLWVKDPQKHYYIAQKLMKQDGEAEVTVVPVPHTEPIEPVEDEVALADPYGPHFYYDPEQERGPCLFREGDGPLCGKPASAHAPPDSVVTAPDKPDPERLPAAETPVQSPPPEPVPEPVQPDSGIDWKKEGKDLGLSQIEVLNAARDVAKNIGITMPGSLRHIGDDLAPALFAELARLSDAKAKRKQAAKEALAEAEA